MPTQGRRRQRDHAEDSDEDERPRQRRNARNAEPDEDESEGNADSDEEMDEDGPTAEQSADQQLAKKLIRLAISCEYARQPMRRDQIKEKVLGNHSRAFRRVFELAQKELRRVWGMEMQELPLREKMSLQEKRKALNSSTQAKTGSGAYILCSTLPAAYRAPKIITPSLAPSAEAEATYTAFYSLIVACIWLGGGELSDQKLKRHLTRLNADRMVWGDKTDVVLKKMEKHGYVIRRAEKPPVGQESEAIVTWHVGVRAKEEIGLDGVIGMVKEVYGGTNADLEKKLKSSLGIKTLPGERELDDEEDAAVVDAEED